MFLRGIELYVSGNYSQRFTPRKKGSNWSDLNKKRARELIEKGRMTEAGLSAIDETVLTNNEEKPRPAKELVLPPYIEKALAANSKARETFSGLAPGYKRQYIGWVTTAKKEETRERRLRELISVLEKNEKLGMK